MRTVGKKELKQAFSHLLTTTKNFSSETMQRKEIIMMGILLLLLSNARAEVLVENIDVNKTVQYTLEDIQIDANISADENKSIIVQLFDNNALLESKSLDVNSQDGNKQYYSVSFVNQFTEGNHLIDVNIVDSNYNYLHHNVITINVMANPLNIDENMSWDLIQQYVLPIARSLSECLVEKTDLNVLYTQNQATLRSLENDVGIANADKEAAESLLAVKNRELESSTSARATCEADKTTMESKILNCDAKCENEKNNLKNNEEDVCTDKLLLKDETIQQRDNVIIAQSNEKASLELIAFVFGSMFFLSCALICFLYFKGMIKVA